MKPGRSDRFQQLFPIGLKDHASVWQQKTYDSPSHAVAQIVESPMGENNLIILYAGLGDEGTLHIGDSYLYDADASYVILERGKQLVSGDWERDDELTSRLNVP